MICTYEWPCDEHGVGALPLMAIWIAVWSRCEVVVEWEVGPSDSLRYLGER